MDYLNASPPSQDLQALDPKAAALANTRAKIYGAAGDPETLLGLTNNMAAAALIGTAYIAQLLAAHGGVDIQAALASPDNPIPLDLVDRLLSGVKNKSIRPPLNVKGVAHVFDDMVARGNATADVLAMANAPMPAPNDNKI